MSGVMMKCGCVSQGETLVGGQRGPICIPCMCTDVADVLPDLAGRMAKCGLGGCTAERPSSVALPFFKYLGAGSPTSRDICTCGFHAVAHGKANKRVCGVFTPKGPADHDEFYCGCRGWD